MEESPLSPMVAQIGDMNNSRVALIPLTDIVSLNSIVSRQALGETVLILA